MGSQGVDVILSPLALRVFPFAIECKAVEALNVTGVFFEHFGKYAASPLLKLLIHTRNRQAEPLVTLRLSDFLTLIMKGTGAFNGKVQNVTGRDETTSAVGEGVRQDD